MRSISLIILFICVQFFTLYSQNTIENLKLIEKIEIYFESNKHQLGSDAPSILYKAEKLYNQNPKRKIRITAHTDGVGKDNSNYILSDKRANAVKYYFMEHGIPSDAIAITTMGKDFPIATNDKEDGRKFNRRATIEVYEPTYETVYSSTNTNGSEQVIIEKQQELAKAKEVLVEKKSIVNKEKEELANKQMQLEKIKAELAEKQRLLDLEKDEILKKESNIEKTNAEINEKQVVIKQTKDELAIAVEKTKEEIAMKQQILEQAKMAINETNVDPTSSNKTTNKTKVITNEQKVVVEKTTTVEKPVVENPVKKEIEKQVVIEKPKETVPTQKPETVVVEKQMPKVVDISPAIRARITNIETGSGVKSTIYYTNDSGVEEFIETDEAGYFEIPGKDGENKSMEVYSKGFFYQSFDAKFAKSNSVQSIRIKPLTIGSSYVISNLYFKPDMAVLVEASKPQLTKVLRFMKVNDGIAIELGGHVNAPGIEPKKLPKSEFELSVNRAKFVHDYLLNNDVNSNHITYKGYGNSKMKNPTARAYSNEELENMRVEIKILKL